MKLDEEDGNDIVTKIKKSGGLHKGEFIMTRSSSNSCCRQAPAHSICQTLCGR